MYRRMTYHTNGLKTTASNVSQDDVGLPHERPGRPQRRPVPRRRVSAAAACHRSSSAHRHRRHLAARARNSTSGSPSIPLPVAVFSRVYAGLCVEMWPDAVWKLVYSAALMALQYLLTYWTGMKALQYFIPLLVLTVCYSTICYVIWIKISPRIICVISWTVVSLDQEDSGRGGERPRYETSFVQAQGNRCMQHNK